MTSAFRVERSGAFPTHGMPEEFEGIEPLVDGLVREFDAPVGLLDPSSRRWVIRRRVPELAFPDPVECLRGLTASGNAPLREAMLWSSDGAADVIWLALPILTESGHEAWAFVGFHASPSSTSSVGTTPYGSHCPRRALKLWGHAVVEDLRAQADCHALARAASASRTREVPLLESLIRWLRVSDAPERFQRLAVSGLREELGVETVAWVPAQPRDPVLISHEDSRFSTEVLRALVADSLFLPIHVLHRPPVAPEIEQAVIIAAEPDHPGGWLIAINPSNGRSPSRTRIELMQLVALLIGTQRSNARLYADLKDLLFGVIRALTSAIDAKDPYTCGHSERVARIAVRLAEQLGMSPNQRGDLYLMGLLHDVGKIGIDDDVLKKPGKLTPEEFRTIQSHVRIGVHILSDLKKLHHLLPGVAHHHESYDGKGYPSGLARDDIPWPARILAVADAYDAMSSTRPYRKRLSPGQIDEIFRDGAGKQWDPNIVTALFECRSDVEQIRQKGLGDSLNKVVDDQLGRL